MKKLFFISFALIFLASCTIDKRQHMSGYHIEWKGNKDVSKTNSFTAQVESKKDALLEEKTEIENSAQSNSRVEENHAIADKNLAVPIASNPLINDSFIAQEINKSNQEKVKYSEIEKKSQNQKIKKANQPAASAGEKSWLIALLLCFFLGGLGIHRFYLGYSGIGLLMLFTGGVFGLLWFIDFVRILIRDLGPKNGSYND